MLLYGLRQELLHEAFGEGRIREHFCTPPGVTG